MARTGIRFHMPVSVAFDDARTTAEAAVNDFYRMLEEAEQAGFMERQLIDISYGQATGHTAFTLADGSERSSGQTGELAAWAHSLGLEADDLDELVHETVSHRRRRSTTAASSPRSSSSPGITAQKGPAA